MKKATKAGITTRSAKISRKTAPASTSIRISEQRGTMVRVAKNAAVKKPKTLKDHGLKVVTATELKTYTSKCIQAALKAPVKIERNGEPIAVIVSLEEYECLVRFKKAAEKKPFPFGIGKNHPSINKDCDQDEFFRPMTDAEVEAFLEGKC